MTSRCSEAAWLMHLRAGESLLPVAPCQSLKQGARFGTRLPFSSKFTRMGKFVVRLLWYSCLEGRAPHDGGATQISWLRHSAHLRGGAATGGNDAIFPAPDQFSKKSDRYNLKINTKRKWYGIHKSPPDRIGITHLENLAAQA